MIKIKDEEAIIQLISTGNIALNQNLEAILKKPNVRKSEIDKIKMENSFLPGDFIKARIV